MARKYLSRDPLRLAIAIRDPRTMITSDPQTMITSDPKKLSSKEDVCCDRSIYGSAR